MYSNDIILTPSPKKLNPKLALIIWAVIFVLFVVCITAWLLYVNIGASVSLKSYQGEGYSMQVPANYIQTSESKDEFNNIDKFVKPGTSENVKQSKVIVTSTTIPNELVRDRLIDNIKNNYYTNEGFKSGLFSSIEGLQGSKVVFGNTDKAGNDVYVASGNLLKDNDPYGNFKQAIVVGANKSYVILLIAYKNDSVFWNKADEIIGSFSIN